MANSWTKLLSNSRDRAAEEVALRLALQKELSEASPDGSVAVSPEGKIVFANRRLAELCGCPSEMLASGMPIEQALEEVALRCTDPERFGHDLLTMRSNPYASTTVAMELLDGAVLECSWAPMVGEKGELRGRLVTFRDVSARRGAERKMQAQARRQGVLTKLSQRALRATDLVPLIEEVVSDMLETLGVDLCMLTELLPDGQSVVVRAGAGFRLAAAEQRIPAGAETEIGQAMMSDGPLVVADVRSERALSSAPLLISEEVRSSATLPIRGLHGPFGTLSVHERTFRIFHPGELEFIAAAGNLIGAAADRLRAAEALQESERSFRNMIENAPDLVLVHRGGRIIYANQAALAALGVESLTARAVLILDLVHSDERQEMVERIRDAQNGLAAPLQEFRMLRANGAEIHVECRAIRVNVGGQPAVLTSGRDVTERRALQARLQLSDRLASVGTLAAGVAHELNNPLAYISANLGYLAEVLPRVGGNARLIDEMIQAVVEAREGSERMRDIVRDMKTFSRPDEDQRSPVDLRRVAESALRLAGADIRHRATLVKDLGEVPLVTGNEGRLGQVCINLLVNAAQALPADRFEQNRISISTLTDQEGRAVLEVRDTGSGIAPENLARIFDPFFTTKPVGLGTGLGLSICHTLITAHGGHIEVKSKLGQGTLFRVVLPALKPPQLDPS